MINKDLLKSIKLRFRSHLHVELVLSGVFLIISLFANGTIKLGGQVHVDMNVKQFFFVLLQRE